jgi:hypothetical protein
MTSYEDWRDAELPGASLDSIYTRVKSALSHMGEVFAELSQALLPADYGERDKALAEQGPAPSTKQF